MTTDQTTTDRSAHGELLPGEACTDEHTTCVHPEGATLYLGGSAWAHPALADSLVPVESLTLYPGNPRRGDQDAITASVRDLGIYKAQITHQTSTGHVLTGNHTLRALLDLGAELAPATAVDVPDARAAAIVARDNRTSDLGVYDDAELLALLTSDEEVLAVSGYTGGDLEELAQNLRDEETASATGPVYSKTTSGLQYEPTMEEAPPVAELVDRGRTDALTRQITEAEGLPVEVRDFLIDAAQRHLVFNYAAIAEFYAHATRDVQRLMEASALVIIDFHDAAQLGYVSLSQRLTEILADDLAERAALDDMKPGAVADA